MIENPFRTLTSLRYDIQLCFMKYLENQWMLIIKGRVHTHKVMYLAIQSNEPWWKDLQLDWFWPSKFIESGWRKLYTQCSAEDMKPVLFVGCSLTYQCSIYIYDIKDLSKKEYDDGLLNAINFSVNTFPISIQSRMNITFHIFKINNICRQRALILR